LCLLTGIVTDTRGLRTSNVDAPVLRAVLRLVEAGAPLAEVARRTLDQRPLSVIRLWGQAMDHLHLDDGILWTEVSHAMLRRWSASGDGVTGLSNFLAGVCEANVVAIFTERDEGRTVDVGLRAAPGYDVSGVALRLGGGGHPQAAGCTLEGELAQVRDLVLAEIRRSLKEQAQRTGA
jgi:phosphoesterase RecJ-like protein